MMELLRVFTHIALSRMGPQDLPASPILLVLTVVGYFLVNYGIYLLMPPGESWRIHLLVDTLFTLGWYSVLLRAFGKPERFLQTATAMFGFQLVLAPLWIGGGYLAQKVGDDSALQFPALVIVLTMVVWVVRAGGYILKAALELPMAASVALVILQLLAGQLVLFAMTPQSEMPAHTIEEVKVKGT